MENAKFVLSKSAMLRQYSRLKEVADKISYSFKTNPTVGTLLEKYTDSLFTVHFAKSLERINDRGRVIFVAQSWNGKAIRELMKLGVHRFIVDNHNDLETLLKELKSKDRIDLFLRLRMKERTIRTERHYVYGMYSAEVNRLVSGLRGDDRIEKLGVHFHRKTMNIGEWDLKSEMAEVLEEETLKAIDMLDIGGGIPIEYKNYNGDDLLPSIMGKIGEFRNWLNKEYGIMLIAEPGRFIAGPCISLDAGIIGINGNTVLINCSVFNSAMDTIVANIKLKVDGELERGTPYLIKGCIPDSEDIFRYRVYLKKPEVGDRIRFLNAGAYTYTTNFCDLDKLEYQMVE